MLDQMAQAWLDSVARKDAVIMLLAGERNDARAEVVQLRDDLERLSQHYQGLMRECDAKDVEIERLKVVAEAAHEVWWDGAMPSRWFEASLFPTKDEHSKALKRALKAVGYTMQLKFTTHSPKPSGSDKAS